jgi:hypothetical protein
VIYYYFPADQQVWLVTLYDKNEASDLTPKQKQALKSAIENDSGCGRPLSLESKGSRGGKRNNQEKDLR